MLVEAGAHLHTDEVRAARVHAAEGEGEGDGDGSAEAWKLVIG